jgi:bifunctional non-homologous end joining protein LigD
MALKAYRRKRDFNKTPEPSPQAKSAVKSGRFFVQRHDASHLHYDFRLAIDGVLKSWAVPKGPSMDPAIKRLAMEVEDHPLAYGTFEGNIPKGEYGGGSVMLWDTGTFHTEGATSAGQQWNKGRLAIRLEGEKLRGGFSLVRMKGKATGKEWLLVKGADEESSAEWNVDDYAYSVATRRTQEEIASGAAAPSRLTAGEIKPMLALLAQELPEGPEWIYEVKWDGVRTLCTVENRQALFQSRNGLSYNSAFPELSGVATALELSSGVLDGEIVAMDAAGKIGFQAIQPRLGKVRSGKNGEGPRGISIYLFDILFKDGKDLRNLPLRKRRAILSEILRPSDRIRLSPVLDGSAQAVMEAAAEHELEGVLAKRLDSPYTGGRGGAWVKVKLQQRQEFVICGWIEGKRSSFGALVLGLFKGNQLYWCGNVGTGFSEALLKEIWATLKATALTRKPAFATGEWQPKMNWVAPTLVGEIRFAEWTTGSHLRAPVFLGLRKDRAPKDCVRENPVPKANVQTKSTSKVPFSNLDKVYFPKEMLTKGDLLSYYEKVAPVLLPHLKDRPASLKRYPDGIAGKSFFQKNLPPSTPDWVPSLTLYSEDSKRDIRYPLVQDLDVLLYVVNLGCIDHNPWMSRKQTLDSPDYVLFDLDPFQCDFDTVITAAHHLREVLDHLKMQVFVKTSGSNGLHVVAPLKTGYGYEEVKEFTAALASTVIQTRPDLFTIEWSLAKRTPERVYFDYVQIGKGKTIAAPYSVRPRDGAPVSAPLQWEELVKGLRPGDFHIGNMPERIKKVGDLWAPVLKSRQSIPKAPAKVRGR